MLQPCDTLRVCLGEALTVGIAATKLGKSSRVDMNASGRCAVGLRDLHHSFPVGFDCDHRRVDIEAATVEVALAREEGASVRYRFCQLDAAVFTRCSCFAVALEEGLEVHTIEDM